MILDFWVADPLSKRLGIGQAKQNVTMTRRTRRTGTSYVMATKEMSLCSHPLGLGIFRSQQPWFEELDCCRSVGHARIANAKGIAPARRTRDKLGAGRQLFTFMPIEVDAFRFFQFSPMK